MNYLSRLEFNEKQKGFHFERHGHYMHRPATHGWETIEDQGFINDYDKFCDYFYHVHKDESKWTKKLVVKEWKWYKKHIEYCTAKDN